IAATPLHDRDGHVVVIRDMTREAEVDRLKTEFLSNVSHELRTPLTPIKAYADMLARRPDMPAETRSRAVTEIAQSSERMARVVDLLVDVAALDAGSVVPEPAAVDVGAIVDARLRAWRERAPGRTFRRRVARGLPPVQVDERWVGKALDELVDNAVKFSPARKPVVVSAAQAGARTVRIAVQDQGPGIEPDQRDALFGDFRQVDASATRRVGGLGLGLSFVRRVATAFGFTADVESSPGKARTRDPRRAPPQAVDP
ncbi:MAG: HAMP domain-containing histidine kinase, partial [Frankia sp.]|nr:HAMP domain-containing histidine kinase [Frankia sp.]